MTAALRQWLAVVGFNLGALRLRGASSLVIVGGVASVVVVLVGLLAATEGFDRVLARGGDAARAIALRDGVTGEGGGAISALHVALLEDQPGVLAASGEVVVVSAIEGPGIDRPANISMRGVADAAFRIRPEVNVLAGRVFTPGRKETIAGRRAVAEYDDLALGSTVALRGEDWRIVGIFESAGSAYESELWVDLATLQSEVGRGSNVGSVRLRLASPDALEDVRRAVAADGRLDLEVQSEVAWLSSQMGHVTALIESFGYIVGGIMGLGAVFAGLNTMYAAVEKRRTEIATLRALGFDGTGIVLSIFVEGTLLALLGAGVGCVTGWAVFNGWTSSMLNQNSYSQVIYEFAVTPATLIDAATLALALGVLGCLAPAIHAVRRNVAASLHQD